MAIATDFLSRERLAGYDPEALSTARVVVVGAGALGQNVVLPLALSGLRSLVVVDPDAFEGSNRTRSPYYKEASPKAQAVAEGFLRSATHAAPEAYFWPGLVQDIGDLITGGLARTWSPTVVVSAVDSTRTRAWLSELCRYYALPLVEAGFDGSALSVTAISNLPDVEGEPCWGCGRRRIEDPRSRGLCSLYATEVEAQGQIPAIQTAAQVAGGLVAEAAIGFVHLDRTPDATLEARLRARVPLAGRRWHLDVRTGRSTLARLALDPACVLSHDNADPSALAGVLPSTGTLGELLTRIGGLVPCFERVEPREPLVLSLPCRTCGRAAFVGRARSAVTQAPVCAPGTCATAAAGGQPDLRPSLGPEDHDLLDLPLATLGLSPGSVLRVHGRPEVAFIQLAGTVPEVLPQPHASTKEP